MIRPRERHKPHCSALANALNALGAVSLSKAPFPRPCVAVGQRYQQGGREIEVVAVEGWKVCARWVAGQPRGARVYVRLELADVVTAWVRVETTEEQSA